MQRSRGATHLSREAEGRHRVISINLIRGGTPSWSDNSGYQVLCKTAPDRPFGLRGHLASTLPPSLHPRLMERILGKSPLRLILSRTLVCRGCYQETLECGHSLTTYQEFLWDEKAHLVLLEPTAKRRRCHECKAAEQNNPKTTSNTLGSTGRVDEEPSADGTSRPVPLNSPPPRSRHSPFAGMRNGGVREIHHHARPLTDLRSVVSVRPPGVYPGIRLVGDQPMKPVFCTRGPHLVQAVCPDAYGVPCSSPLPTDEELKERAFDAYRIAHGIPESSRLGDMPLPVISEVLRAAQDLKLQEAKQHATL